MLNKIVAELKQLIPVALPAVLSQLAQMAMGVIDTIMAGHYNNDALAAIAIGTSLLHPVMIFFMGLFLAFNPIIAHLNGSDDRDKIGSNFRLGLVLALCASPIAIFALVKAPLLLTTLGVESQTAQLATGYLYAILWGMPCLLLFLALRFCNEGLFSMPAILTATLISIPFNIVFNYWFMYGGLGLAPMGAVGVGYSTTLVWSIMFCGLLVYTSVTSKYADLNIFRQWQLPAKHEILEVFKLGLPLAITLGFEISLFAAVSLMIARYPAEFMGAHQIALNIASLAFMVPLGIAQATTARVGYFNGKKKPQAVRLAGYTGIATAAAMSTLSASAMILIPAWLVSIYTADQQVIQISVGLLFFAAVFQFSDSIQVASSGALRGVKDSKIPMIITAISYWIVGFPSGYYLADKLNYQVNGYWMGLIAGLTTAASLLLYRWHKLSKKTPH